MKAAYVLVALAVVACAVSVRAGDDDESEPVGTVIGIDLGTTYSCVGVYKNGRVEIIANDQGNRITPSYVAWAEDGERLIGDAAKNQATINPSNTVFDVKRLIGRKYKDKTVQADKKMFPFNIISKDGKPYVEVQVEGKKRSFAPEEVSAMILQKNILSEGRSGRREDGEDRLEGWRICSRNAVRRHQAASHEISRLP